MTLQKPVKYSSQLIEAEHVQMPVNPTVWSTLVLHAPQSMHPRAAVKQIHVYEVQATYRTAMPVSSTPAPSLGL